MLLIILLINFGLIGIFIWVLIHILVLHPEKGERIAGWLARLVSWTSKRAQRTATAISIQKKVHSFIDAVNTEVERLLPYKLKIKWVSPKIDETAFISNDRVIVFLRHDKNQDVNIAKSTMLYMNKAVIPEARPHIHFRLCEAIDLMMTKKALYSFVEARSAFAVFVSDVLRPKADKDSDLKELCTIIEQLDTRGLFTRVLLRELAELGKRRAGITESGGTVFETGKFTKFLTEIAEKEQGEDVPLTFNGKWIKAAVILVARPDTATEAFITQIKKKIVENINVIYVFARGRNVETAKRVCEECTKVPELTMIHEGEEFPTMVDERNIIGYCVIFYNRKTI